MTATRQKAEQLLTTAFVCATCFAASLAVAAEKPDADGSAYFEMHVRPLLVEHCYKCHSSESDPLRGGLRLDSRPGWEAGGDSGPAIEPGKPDDSLLIEAVRYGDNAEGMPPEGKLSDDAVAKLTRWVEMGAPDPRDEAAPAAKQSRVIDFDAESRHWAYQPFADCQPPTVDDEWVRTPIDRFVLAQLAAAGLRPNPIADRRTLIRRAYFDLTGLPPTLEEVDAFVADSDPHAYEKLVDRLLESDHYGERWARHWLDLARFAESHGFEHDYDRPYAYHYRDFVIRALNQDMPYDQFVRWQLAGDEFAPDDPLALAATGFLAAGVHSTQITKNQVEKERYDELDDIVSTLGTSMLGLTIGCCRCHDHKYDPLPTEDYYRLVATFTTAVRSEMEVPVFGDEYAAEKREFDGEHARLAELLAQRERDELPARLDAWLAERRNADASPVAGRWQTARPRRAESAGGAAFAQLDDGSLRVTGERADHDVYTFVLRTRQANVTALRLEALADDGLKHRGPGRADNGNFALSDVRLTAAPLGGGDAQPVKIASASAVYEQQGLAVAGAIDDDPQTAWAVDGKLGENHAAVFTFAQPIGDAQGVELTVTLRFDVNTGHSIGRPRLAIATGQASAIDAEPTEQAEGEILALAALDTAVDEDSAVSEDKIVDEGRGEALEWFRTLDPAWRRLRQTIDYHASLAPRPNTVKMLITSEGVPAVRLHTQGDDFLPHTHFLRRGDPTQKTGVAEQGFLRVLMNTPDGASLWQEPPPAGWRTSYRRRALANWITDTDAGAGDLLARVAVNRLWQHHLGRGIVSTPSDFGAQGEPPTHPELLDWLARQLVADGWRLKPLHKLIMTSAVYMQTTDYDETRAALDVGNRLFWRRERRRLEAEAIRDAMLAAAGGLDPTMYGPGVLDGASPRRSVYLTVKRSKLVPMMLLFDAPDALQGVGTRTTTTVAPQALLLLNNAFVRRTAEQLAERADVQGTDAAGPGDWAPVIERAYGMTLSRRPEPEETASVSAFLTSQEAACREAGAENPRRAAIADFCQTLLGLNEFAYVD